ncbi:MAG: dihydroorotate dehydrogenase electron transfer subunit [Thermogutta sp.]
MSGSSRWHLLTQPDKVEVWFGTGEIVVNEQVARETFCLRIFSPPIAEAITPGQFVMVRLPGTTDPLLGRAFALYDVVENDQGESVFLEIAYAAIGRMTRRLATLKPGNTIEIWGPLGNGFPVPQTDELILVAGGIGYTPFLAVAKEVQGIARYGKNDRGQSPCRSVKLLFGVRSRDYVPTDIDRFSAAGVHVVLSSDDGSIGTAGVASDLLESELASGDSAKRMVYCCGPEPLMAKVAHLCQEKNVKCLLSLETPMACGLGLCYGCVTKIRTDANDANQWDYRRVCVEGPVFDARQVVFE